MRGLVWFRRDLRIRDNPALSTACRECDEVVPLFVFDDALLNSRRFGSACVTFMLGCLRELSQNLKESGLHLIWRRGDQAEEVKRAVEEYGVSRIYWNRDYEPAALDRDRRVQDLMNHRHVMVQTFKDHVIFEADEVCGMAGGPLQRYSAYRNRWWAVWHAGAPRVVAAPRARVGRDQAFGKPLVDWPTAEQLGYQTAESWIQPGEHAAHQRLRWFLDSPIHQYVSGRNRPGVDGTAKLSPHFRFGTLSSRQAVHAALAQLRKDGRASRADVLTWIDELIWREFFQQVLSAFPRVASGPFRSDATLPAPREKGPERERLFTAWCNGKTGYPIIDAGMRQLNQTGWMHNRVRMVVASFLIKDLRLDWQSGEQYFMQRLVDADVAANNGNWQWCASTGTDALRGYRIFNPALQSKKFDPDGTYIRTYVPELDPLPAKLIHEPHLMSQQEQRRLECMIGTDYPLPIVDHLKARNEYLELGKQAKGRSFMRGTRKESISKPVLAVRVGISRCLLGDAVRYDGGHKRNSFLVDVLGSVVEWVPVCPEVEAGMTTPREAIRLVGDARKPHLVTVKSGQDLTTIMSSFSTRRVAELEANDLSGYVFKKDSPSCGMERVRVLNHQGMPARNGIGIFAKTFMEQFPLIPVEEEGRLCDPVLRDNFIERVFSYHRWRLLMLGPISRKCVVEFHTAHKYALLAHSRDHYQALGHLTAQSDRYRPKDLIERYGRIFMEALKVKATVRKHVNVLHHLVGFFKFRLNPDERAELEGVIEDYHKGIVPLVVPLTLIKHYVKTFEITYIQNQVYLHPHPKELMLRNRV